MEPGQDAALRLLINQLTALVRTRLRRMQYQRGLLEGFLAKPRLDLGNFHN